MQIQTYMDQIEQQLKSMTDPGERHQLKSEHAYWATVCKDLLEVKEV